MSPPASHIDTTFYRKTSKGLQGAVDLDADAAKVFAIIDGNIQLSKVAELADVSTAVLWKAIAKLTRLGLVESTDNEGGFMGRAFVDELQNEFAKAVGPISNILLDKVTAQMEITFPNIPAERARELVNRLVEQIPDENGRSEFEQTLLKHI